MEPQELNFTPLKLSTVDTREVSESALDGAVASTFFAVLLEAVGNFQTVHRDRLSAHLPVDVELLLQGADDYRQVFLSHLHNIDREHESP